MRIGILFTFNPIWMGGLIYLQNLLRTLDFLDEPHKPQITAYFKPELADFVEKLDYPGLRRVPINYPDVKLGTLASWLTRKNRFVDPLWARNEVDVIFPVQDMPVRSDARAVCWYADLQHRYYPEFFSRSNRLERELRIHLMLKHARQLVVSSQAVADDFHRFYRVPESLRVDLYRFVSPLEAVDSELVEEAQARYEIRQPYFIISNQFHKHKNHRTAVKAFGAVAAELDDVELVLTGRPPRLADSPYLRELHAIIEQFGIQNRVRFLGAIPRSDQVALMQGALAVVQPSLFEGWSTVIEDAKSLQVPVIASDLPVHYEQLGQCARYFSAQDSDALSSCLTSAFAEYSASRRPHYESLEVRAKAAATSLLETLRWQAGTSFG